MKKTTYVIFAVLLLLMSAVVSTNAGPSPPDGFRCTDDPYDGSPWGDIDCTDQRSSNPPGHIDDTYQKTVLHTSDNKFGEKYYIRIIINIYPFVIITLDEENIISDYEKNIRESYSSD